MDNPITYAGFTIGPIHEVIDASRRTRETWFASYFFSWFMRQLVRKLYNPGVFEFLTPFLPKNDESGLAGRYHDRFVAESVFSVNETNQRIQAARDKIIDYFSKVIDDLIKKKDFTRLLSKDKIEDILSNYLRTSFVVLPAAEVPKDEVVKTVDKYLDTLELNRSFRLGRCENTCELCRTLPAVAEAKIWRLNPESRDDEFDKAKRCPLCLLKYFMLTSKISQRPEVIKEILGTNHNRFLYPSTVEISAEELLQDKAVKDEIEKAKQKKDKDIDIKSIQGAIGHNKTIKPYHKYIAVVQADGDNMGKIAKKVQNPQELSGALFDFATEGVRLIEKYHGQPIYLGGDDVLAFLPTATTINTDFVTVLDFAAELAEVFKEKIEEVLQNGPVKPSLSTGIAIAYYKHPQQFNLQNVRDLMYGKAKQKKDSIALSLLQHSGAKTEIVFHLGASSQFQSFMSLFKGVLSGDIELPQGLHHNLARFQRLLIEIPDEERLTAFFKNTFNEEIHEDMLDGLNYIRDLLWGEIKIARESGEDISEAIKRILNQLKFMHFLMLDKEDNQ